MMELSTGDIVRMSAMVMVSVVVMSRGRRLWMMVDAGSVLMLALAWITMPWILLGSVTTGPLDVFHHVLGRICGATLVAYAITFGLTRNSSDITVSQVLISSRIMGIVMFQLAVGYARMQDLENGGWTQEQVILEVFGGGLLLLGHVYHFARLEHHGCFGQRNDRVSAVLRIDGFIALTSGLMEFAFPDLWLSQLMDPKAVDALHLHMFRVHGSVVFMTGLVSSWAPVFLYDEDKRNVLLARIVQNALVFAVSLYHVGTFHTHMVLVSQAIILLGEGMLVWGYLAPTENKKAA